MYWIQQGPQTKPKVVHKESLWLYHRGACADWLKEPAEGHAADVAKGTSIQQGILEDIAIRNPTSSHPKRRRCKPPRFSNDVSLTSDVQEEALPLQKDQESLRHSERSQRRPHRYID